MKTIRRLVVLKIARLMTTLVGSALLWGTVAFTPPAHAHYDPIMLEALNEAIKSSPDNARAYQARGLIWIHTEDYAAAAADFGEVIRLEPNNAEAYVYRGTSLFWLRDYDTALADFNRAVELDDTVAVVYFNRGYVYRMQGQFARAMADFERGAELAQAQGNRETYQEARSLIDDLEILPILDVPDLMARGGEKIVAGDFLGAATDFAEVLRRPNLQLSEQLEAYRQQAIAWVALGNINTALNNLERVLELDPDYALAYAERGKIYLDQGEFDSAIAQLNQALSLDPTLADAYYQRGITYMELEDYPTAIADFTAAIEQDANLAAAYGGRGLAHFQRGDRPQAVLDLEQATELFRNQGNFTGYQQTLALLATVQETQP